MLSSILSHQDTFVYNPKRVQREARKQVQNTRIGTKSQQSLKLQHCS
ncbi:MAG: YjdF family protein [Lachnospiraceae bacterium]